MSGGRLKEKKIVRVSRAEKRKYVGRGTGRGVRVEKSRVKVRSLYRQRVMLVAVVARNFGVPAVLVLMSVGVEGLGLGLGLGLMWAVRREVTVSIEFAAR